MTLDDAIKHAEEIAEEKEIDVENQNPLFPNDIEECKKSAEEHRQLAEWLKELKQLKEQEFCVTMRELSDDELKHLVEQMKKERLQLISVEQKSNEDCISRQAVLEFIEKQIDHSLWAYEKLVNKIKSLPSVQPKRGAAKWIPLEYDGYADGYPVWDKWECSKCGEEHEGEQDTLTQFCPNCGAEMEVNE